jgi:sugar lactone lactonase YvrE
MLSTFALALILSQAKPVAAAKADAGAVAAPAAAVAPAASVPVMTVSEGLATPESVLYDAAADVYLVSNINGSPLEKDNNGYISIFTPDGKAGAPKFIAGGEKGVTLNAPKGMGIAKGVLYVADLDAVRMFDRKTGAPKGEVAIEGATFLNDIAVEGDRVFVSDSGFKGGAKGFEPSGSDAVYELKKGKAVALARGDELGRPNGLCVQKGVVHVVTFGTNERYALDKAGKKTDVVKLPKGSLDGIVDLKGEDLISSWEGQAVYRVDAKGNATEVLRGLKSPADIGWDSKRKRVLVPRFEENRLEAYEL